MPPGGSSFPHVRKRFYREARSAGKLSHKNIITVHDLGEYKGRPYIAMEFLVGEDLKSKLDRGDWPNLEQQLRWMIETCEGLDHAHKKQVIHRDIKPGNIFITQEGQVKILDFGLARLATSVGTKSGLVVGTPSYMAPEQVRGEKADRRSDIYSAAAMFYELLTHQKPCISESLHGLFYKILEVEPDLVEKLNPLLPKEISPIVSRAMAKNPEERFDTAGELVRELMDIEGSLRSQKLDLRADSSIGGQS
jgi:serine/threonine-protein kinase